MKVFLSWSGERSQGIAEALRDWLPKVIQAVQPWLSAVDIERGARWSTDIASELAQTSFGVLCLTPENLDSSWIHFEAGALSKTLDKTYVCPYLFELEPADLKGPLVQFNAARATKEDTLKLVHTVNDAQEAPLPKAVLEESYEVWWPKLEERFSNLPRPQLEVRYERPEREILEELLDLAREQARMNTSRVDSSDLFDLDENAELAAAAPNIGFTPGSYVQHPKYGRGLVLRREGKGDATRLTVSFPGFGQKKLVQKYAHLTNA
jgi:hypothetical protein